MVTEYGMRTNLVRYNMKGNHVMIPGIIHRNLSLSRLPMKLMLKYVISVNEARNKAAEIIQSNRETHKLIAEALLKYETLDSNQIKSIYETGKISEDQLDEDKSHTHFHMMKLKSKNGRKQLS